MLKNILFSLFAVFLFALGAAGSWFYIQMQNETERAGDEPTAAATAPARPDAGQPTSAGASESVTLPVAARAQPLSAEEIFRWGAMTKQEQQRLREQQENIDKQKVHLKLAQDDVHRRQVEIEGLLAQVNDSLAAGEKLLSDLHLAKQESVAAKADAEKKLQELRQAEEAAGTGEGVNVKQSAGWLEMMKSETAAEIVRELWNDGTADLAVKILSNIESRNVAKILDAVNDPAMVVEITERLVKMPTVRR